MRKGMMIAAAVATLLAPLSASATDWYRVTRGQTATWYVDVDSIQRKGQWTSVREYSVYDTVSERTGVKSAWSLLEIDCSARQIRYAHFSAFDASGTETTSDDWPDDGKLHPIEDGTVLDVLADFVCDGNYSQGVRVKDPETDSQTR
ncbi:MAG: surface-adhesin E family protein [Sphingomonas sp.]